MNTIEPRPYPAAVAIPAPPAPKDIACDIHCAVWYSVGEYPDQRTALHYAHQAAVAHKADCYQVIYPDAEDYDTIRVKMRSLHSLDDLLGNFPKKGLSE